MKNTYLYFLKGWCAKSKSENINIIIVMGFFPQHCDIGFTQSDTSRNYKANHEGVLTPLCILHQ